MSYNPTAGRWSTQDPDGVAAGDADLYCFVGNDPTNARDPSGLVIIIIHGVNDTGKGWSQNLLKQLDFSRPAGDPVQQVYLFKWTKNGATPPLWDGANSLKTMPAYQVAEAKRLKQFIDDANALFKKYNVKESINIIAHSEGSVIALKAISLGADVDNVVFAGSPLDYQSERQNDVIEALPHIRGTLYNYYSAKDETVPVINGEVPNTKGWGTKDLPTDKVKQTELSNVLHIQFMKGDNVKNYLDKVPTKEVLDYEKYKEEWDKIVESAQLQGAAQ